MFKLEGEKLYIADHHLYAAYLSVSAANATLCEGMTALNQAEYEINAELLDIQERLGNLVRRVHEGSQQNLENIG